MSEYDRGNDLMHVYLILRASSLKKNSEELMAFHHLIIKYFDLYLS